MQEDKPIYLLLGIHNHQPVGNFGNVFDEAFEKCYWPLIKMLEKYPDVKMSLHISGPLLDWAMDHEPKYIPTIATLVDRGQVEVLGGGYYEPILPILKSSDAQGQIEMMQDFWRRVTNKTPQGMWLAERVWEPALAKVIADAGLKYTILDDEHFRYAGLPQSTLFNYYTTERAGNSISVFPTDKTMRYLIPFKPVDDVIAHLKKLKEEHPGCAITYGDDGEKFGMWPGTFEWVIKKGWLEKFFQALTEHRHEIVTTHFSQFLSERDPEGRIYLPTASYNEMLEWAMPAESILRFEEAKEHIDKSGLTEMLKPFLRGGLWDNFLSKYSESDTMHKKCIYVSNRLDEAEKTHDLKDARRSLYRAQCNCAYWHGLFGGLYLNYLRNAVYENLIDAENRIDASIHGDNPFIRIEQIDIDGDGHAEVAMASDKILATASPAQGGALTELAWRPLKYNLQNTLTRRFEAYHKENVKTSHEEENELPSIHNLAKDLGEMKAKLIYDELPRRSFLEHVFSADIDHSAGLKPSEAIATFGNEKFKITSCSEAGNSTIADLFGSATDKQGKQFGLQKIYRLERSTLTSEFELSTHEVQPVLFATELNLTLLAGHDPKRYYRWGDVQPGKFLMDSYNAVGNLRQLDLVDEAFGLRTRIQTSENAEWRFEPVETISQSESGFDKFYQGSNIWILFRPQFSNEGKANFSVSISFEEI